MGSSTENINFLKITKVYDDIICILLIPCLSISIKGPVCVLTPPLEDVAPLELSRLGPGPVAGLTTASVSSEGIFLSSLVNHLARHHTVALVGLPPELLGVVERLQSEELGSQAVVTGQESQQVVVLLQAVSPGEGIGQIQPDTNTGQGDV